jgi:hypothetical protein
MAIDSSKSNDQVQTTKCNFISWSSISIPASDILSIPTRPLGLGKQPNKT